MGCLAMSASGPDRITQLVNSYRGGIEVANPIGKFIKDRVAISTLAICGENRKNIQERGSEILDWYRSQQAVRHSRVWQEQDPQNVPQDYQWHYDRSTTDTSSQDNISSLDLIKQGRYCIGNPDDCLKFMEQYIPTGVDEIMPLFQIGTMAHKEVMETLRLFGKHVIPNV